MRPQIVPILTLVLNILSGTSMLAQSVSPPPPAQKGPPELPIDQQIIHLLIIGLAVGLYVVTQRFRSKEPQA